MSASLFQALLKSVKSIFYQLCRKILYRPLPVERWQIRILEILPGDFDDALETKLHVADLLNEREIRICGKHEPVPYTALSYRWGGNNETMKCNYIKCQVTSRALEALKDLRRAEFQDVTRTECQYIWIDSLCIDQNNKKEKAEEIPKMLTIYSKAERVVIWLGKDEHTIKVLLHDLEHRAGAALEEQFNSLMKGSPAEPLGDERYTPPNTPEKTISAMSQLLDLPWFSRVWTKQEVWAAHEAILCYDGAFCNWENFTLSRFERVVGNLSDSRQEELKYRSVCEKLENVRARHERAEGLVIASLGAEDLRNQLLEDNPMHKHDIVNVIRRYSGSECDDDHDYVYGLLGMSTANKYEHDKDDKTKEMLSVSYVQDAARTFENLARYIIGRDDSLSILFLQDAFALREYGPARKELDLPSWVPDWRFQYGTLEWLSNMMDEPLSKQTPRILQTKGFRPGTGLSVLDHRFALKLRGFSFGRITRNNIGGLMYGSGFESGVTTAMDYAMIMIESSIISETCSTERLGSHEMRCAQMAPALREWKVICHAPKRAQPGDIAVAVLGAYAALLIRPKVDRVDEQLFEYIGPVVFAKIDGIYTKIPESKPDFHVSHEIEEHFNRLMSLEKDEWINILTFHGIELINRQLRSHLANSSTNFEDFYIA